MIPPSLPDDETNRLADLHALAVLDTAPEERFDRLTRVARTLFDMPLAQDPLGLTQADWRADPRQVVTRAIDNNTRKSVQHEQIGAVLDHRFDSYLSMQWRAYKGQRENLQYQAGTTAPTPRTSSGAPGVALAIMRSRDRPIVLLSLMIQCCLPPGPNHL